MFKLIIGKTLFLFIKKNLTMKNILIKIITIFIVSFMCRFFINFLDINLSDYLNLDCLSLAFYSYALPINDNSNYKDIDLNYKCLIKNYNSSFRTESTECTKNDNPIISNTNNNVLRESVKNSEKLCNKNKFLDPLKNFNNKIKNKYISVKYKFNLQKTTFL